MKHMNETGMTLATENGAYLGALQLTISVLELAQSGEFLKAAKKAEILVEYLLDTHRRDW